jgi:hypothetical protein
VVKYFQKPAALARIIFNLTHWVADNPKPAVELTSEVVMLSAS